MRLKPHQIGILIALALAAAMAVLWIWGGASGVAYNRAHPPTEHPIDK